jgi:hypothetical protein
MVADWSERRPAHDATEATDATEETDGITVRARHHHARRTAVPVRRA